MTWVRVQGALSYLAGMALLGWEIVLHDEPRWVVISIGLFLIGAPASVLADRKLTLSRKPPADPPPP